jgi:hypothetical protein
LKCFTLIVILIALISSFLYGSSKNNVAQKAILENTEYDQIVMGFGSLQNYVINNIYAPGTGFTYETFLFGRTDFLYPSMLWSEGGYENNHYLYSGAFL